MGSGHKVCQGDQPQLRAVGRQATGAALQVLLPPGLSDAEGLCAALESLLRKGRGFVWNINTELEGGYEKSKTSKYRIT